MEGKSTPDYPLQKKRHSVEFLRTIQHLRPRTNLFSATFRVRSVAAYAIHEFFQSRGFVYVHTPIITGSDCEGAGEMFQVTTLDLNDVPRTEDGQVDYSKDFFGKKTSLTVSGQLNAENFAMAFGDVYTFGPTFRAENSNTQRHAAEFWMIEPEMAFTDLAGDMDVAEAMIKHIIRRVLERCPDEINFFNSFVDKGLKERLTHVMTSDFGRVSYTEAVEILKQHNDQFDFKVDWGTDLQTEHERFLTEQVFKRPVFVTDYPAEIKAFYMRMNDDGKTVAAADCLVPGIGEIIGGSQREERLDFSGSNNSSAFAPFGTITGSNPSFSRYRRSSSHMLASSSTTMILLFAIGRFLLLSRPRASARTLSSYYTVYQISANVYEQYFKLFSRFREKRSKNRLPGRGEMDYARLLSILRENHYRGDFIIEVYRKDFAQISELADAYRFLQSAGFESCFG